MKKYIVYVPISALEVYEVTADDEDHARQLVSEQEGDSEYIEEIEREISMEFYENWIVEENSLDKPQESS